MHHMTNFSEPHTVSYNQISAVTNIYNSSPQLPPHLNLPNSSNLYTYIHIYLFLFPSNYFIILKLLFTPTSIILSFIVIIVVFNTSPSPLLFLCLQNFIQLLLNFTLTSITLYTHFSFFNIMITYH